MDTEKWLHLLQGERNPKAINYFHKATELGKKNYSKAIKYLNKAIELDNTYLQAYVYRAIFYFHLQQYSKAIEDINKTNELPKNPDNAAEDYWMLGECYNGLGEYDKAIASFNKGIEFNWFLDNSYAGRGYAYLKKGQFQAAITNLDKAIELDADNARAYYYRAEYRIATGEKDLAVEELKKAIELAKTDEYTEKNATGELKRLQASITNHG